MIIEVAKSAGEIAKSSAEGSKFNPDARAEVPSVKQDSKAERFNPDARAGETGNKENGEHTLDCRNKELEGKKHPETDVPFERKTVEDGEGNKITGVFPKFDSVYEAKLPKDLEKASDSKQFGECNNQLKESVDKDPKLAEKFTPEQREQIKNGDTPDGYTWHHHEEKGKMQLVDTSTHSKTGHTGGKVIWGGGSENR